MTTDEPGGVINTVPKVIRIENTPGAERLLVDGKQFPFLIEEGGPIYLDMGKGLPVVGVPIFADRVEVLNLDGTEDVHEYGDADSLAAIDRAAASTEAGS